MTVTPPDSTVVWAPEDLPVPPEELAGYSYVVLEEVVGSLALLRRWRWPDVDPFGRLIWPEDCEYDSGAAAASIELLRVQLYTPNKLRRRPRCGDTFAASRLADPAWQAEDQVSDVRSLFAGPVYDISADAREAAKLAYHAGLGAVLPPERVDEQTRSEQARALDARSSLRPLKIAAPPRGSR